eukprot:1256432-Rhodomonas_salina.1
MHSSARREDEGRSMLKEFGRPQKDKNLRREKHDRAVGSTTRRHADCRARAKDRTPIPSGVAHIGHGSYV